MSNIYINISKHVCTYECMYACSYLTLYILVFIIHTYTLAFINEYIHKKCIHDHK